MTIDPRRLLRACALTVWAGFFLYLWLGGAASDYVGRKTAWVVPFGAIVLTLSALASFTGVRTKAAGRRPSLAEVMGVALLLAPVLIVFMIPSPTLGALAVKRKGNKGALRPRDRDRGTPLTLADIAWAADIPEFRQTRGVSNGRAVEFTGFVSKARIDQIEVSHFYVTCCVADAVALTVRVTRPGIGNRFKADDWVRVKGNVAIKGPAVTVVAREVQTIAKPNNPYDDAY